MRLFAPLQPLCRRSSSAAYLTSRHTQLPPPMRPTVLPGTACACEPPPFRSPPPFLTRPVFLLFCASFQAVLESVAELSTPPTTFPIPTKGTYITFKSGGGTHEAHVSVRSVASVALSTEPAKVGGHDLHVMRLLGVGGGPILSLLVAWAEGEGPGSYVRWPLPDFAYGRVVGAFFGSVAAFSGRRRRVRAL